jgi:hypothetical protein
VGLGLAVPFVVFALHAFALGDWIIDDAGISYAYARNLVEGHGLVAQPGAELVEGFTNILWVLILALPMRLGLFDTATTPKLLSGVMVFGAYLAIAAAARRAAPEQWVWICCTSLSITSLATGFVAWTVSGLENGLYALLVALLVLGVIVATTRSSVRAPCGAALGLLVVLLFMTRPDGILYLPLLPVVLALARGGRRRTLLVYSLVVGLGFGLLTLFRLAYFGDVLPNTYYAKRGPLWELASSTLDSAGLLLGGGSMLLIGTVALVAGSFVCYWLAERAGRLKELWSIPLVALWGATAISWIAYEALPTDWMPEFRFATPLFLLAPITVITTLARAAQVSGRATAGARWWVSSLAVVAVGVAATVGWVRSSSFRSFPPVPFEHALALSERLEGVARLSGRDRVSVLLPDIGGPLWRDRLDVVDLAGLTDPVIARTLVPSRPDFHDYILGEIQPGLIWLHGRWVEAADLQADSRFGKQYRLIWSDRKRGDPGALLYARKGAFDAPMRLLRRAYVTSLKAEASSRTKRP